MKVSVITAVFNARDTIRDVLTSIRSQSHRAVEHVVIDGGSTDGTLDILNEHKANIQILISEPDNGIYDALNKGINASTGDVIGVLHADDFFSEPTGLAQVATQFINSATDVVYGDLDYVSKHPPHRTIRRWRAGEFSRRKLYWGWMPPHPSLYVHRRIFQRFGGYDTDYRIAADYDLILRIFQEQIRWRYIPVVLTKMRVGGESNRSLRNLIRKSAEDYRAMKRNKVGGFGSLIWKNVSKVSQYL